MKLFGNQESRERKAAISILEENLSENAKEINEIGDKIALIKSQENCKAACKWEYIIDEDLDHNELDARGSRGWELVTAASYTTGLGIGGSSSMTVHMKYVFKRKVVEHNLPEIQELQKSIDVLFQRREYLKTEINKISLI